MHVKHAAKDAARCPCSECLHRPESNEIHKIHRSPIYMVFILIPAALFLRCPYLTRRSRRYYSVRPFHKTVVIKIYEID